MSGPSQLKLRFLGTPPLANVGYKQRCFLHAPNNYAIVDGVISRADSSLAVTGPLGVASVPADSTLFDVQDGAALVLVDGSLSLLTGGSTKKLDVPGAAGARFAAGGILASAPQDGGDGHKLFLLTRDGEVKAEHFFKEAYDAAAWIHPHPSSQAVVVEFAMGQDGCFSVVATLDVEGGSIAAEPLALPDEYTIAGFSPDGSKLLLTAHPNNPRAIGMMEWTTREITHSIAAADVLHKKEKQADEDDDDDDYEDEEPTFDVHGGWVAPGVVIANTTQFGLHVLVADSNLANARLAELPVPGLDGADEAETMSLVPTGDRRFLARTWVDGESATTLFEVDE